MHFVDGTVKKVDHYHGDRSAPSELGWLEDRIDVLSGTELYIGEDWERQEKKDWESDEWEDIPPF